MPGSAASSPATTRRSVGTPVIRRSTRRTRSERSTLKVSVAGTSAIPMTMKSNTLQGSRKKATRWTMTRAAISTTNTARMMWSRISSSHPYDAIIVLLVSRPRMTALTTISDMITRSVRGSFTTVVSQASTVPPCGDRPLCNQRDSIHHNIVLFNDVAPTPRLLGDEGRHLRRAVADRLDARGAEFRLHVRHLDGLDRGLRDLGDQRLRRLGWCRQREPAGGHEARQTGFGGRRYFRKHGRAMGVRQRQDLHPSVAEWRSARGEVAEEDIDVTADHVVEHQILAAVGHVHHARIGHTLKHHAGQMRGCAVPLAAECHLARVCLDVVDQLLERIHRQLFAHDHHVRHRADHGDRHELLRLKGELLVKALIDRERSRRAEQQCVTVALRLVGELGADIATGAGLVLDDDRLPPLALQFFPDN